MNLDVSCQSWLVKESKFESIAQAIDGISEAFEEDELCLSSTLSTTNMYEQLTTVRLTLKRWLFQVAENENGTKQSTYAFWQLQGNPREAAA